MIITIDGSVGTGKSTLAKALAHELGFIYLDTGAMYRAFTYGLIKAKVDFHDEQKLAAFLKNFTFDIKVHFGHKRYFFEGEDITDKIRNADVTALVSEISAIGQVREKLVLLQRQIAAGVNAVVEGRDMGTVVFPQAEIKIFLTGRPEVRAVRRFEEIKAKNPQEAADLTLAKVLEDINRRDSYDSTRALSPLKPPEDALIIDTSDLGVEDIVAKILEYKDSFSVY